MIIKGLDCAAHNRGLGWRRGHAHIPFVTMSVINRSYKRYG